MNLVELAFVLLGALALGAGALAVTTARVVHAALWLAASLAAVAGCFLLLTAELLVWIQVLIYVGAVVVLVLFALMLTRAPTGPAPGAPRGRLIVAGVVAAATAAVLLGTLLGTLGDERIDLESSLVDCVPAPRTVAIRARHQTVESIVEHSQPRLQRWLPLLQKRHGLEQRFADVFAFAVQAVPDPSASSSDRDFNQPNCAFFFHDVCPPKFMNA